MIKLFAYLMLGFHLTASAFTYIQVATEDQSLRDIYLNALYFFVSTAATIGYGDKSANLNSIPNILFICFYIAIGINYLGGIISTFNIALR